MRILTRGDLDGLASCVLLTLVHSIREVRFAHPKSVQDGEVNVTDQDIVVNLPYIEGCGLWFDHHVSEERKLDDIGAFKGRFAVAPSAARVIYDHYKDSKFDEYAEMLEATDRVDSANLTKQDVLDPQGWIRLAYTLDPRTGLGAEFQKYFRWLVEYVKEVPIQKVLWHPQVYKRSELVRTRQQKYFELISDYSEMDGNVIITDFRTMEQPPIGNRFLVFTVFPEGNVEVRLLRGKAGNTVAAVGRSIFNRTCIVNIGDLMARHGGGGHAGAGTCQFDSRVADEKIAKIVKALKESN